MARSTYRPRRYHGDPNRWRPSPTKTFHALVSPAAAEKRRQLLLSYGLSPGQRVTYRPGFLYGECFLVCKVSAKEILVSAETGEILEFCGPDTGTPGYWRPETCNGRVLIASQESILHLLEFHENSHA